MENARKGHRGNAKKKQKNGYEDSDASTQRTLQELRTLIQMFPGSPEFFGENIKYPKPKKDRLFAKERYPDLTKLREEINKFAEKERVSHARAKVQKALRKYPNYYDLHALNAIQVFNDATQSGLDNKKITVVKNAVLEMGRALHNGGMTIFNATWFLKIYIAYLEILNDKVKREYSNNKQHHLERIRILANKLNHVQTQLAFLLKIRDQIDSLKTMSYRLKNSVYITEPISPPELKSACTAIQSGDETRKVGKKKTSGHIIYVYMTLTLIFSRIPLLKKLVTNMLSRIPDISRDLVLQKNMIVSNKLTIEIQMALASGHQKKAAEMCTTLFNNCLDSIGQHLEYALLTRQYEVDPFLKASWVALESKGFLKAEAFKKRLKKSIVLLNTVMGERCQVKGSFALAEQLKQEISAALGETNGDDKQQQSTRRL